MNQINWGIIAPGNIATKFADALNGTERAQLYAVASRSPQRAQAFADAHGFDKVADDYEALANDPQVDAIYIASPHRFHAEQAMMCLQAGKPVLCEKPMTVNAHDAQELIDTAFVNRVFFMEAVWTRFMPIYQQIRTWISDGAVGSVEVIQASFGIHRAFDPEHRLYDANVAGGALLDLGIYPITFAQIATSASPVSITANAHIGNTGVDERTGIVLKYPNGEIATLNATMRAASSCDAWIFGSEGSIHVRNFWFAESAVLYRPRENHTFDDGETVSCPHRINGYEYEIDEVHRCLDEGLTESPLMPWAESLSVVQTMDEVRQQIGLRYPFEDTD